MSVFSPSPAPALLLAYHLTLAECKREVLL